MTSPRLVPTTSDDDGSELDAEDAWHLTRRFGIGTVVRQAVTRFRHADGTSYSRALAIQTALSVVPLLIALTGLASYLHERKISGVIAMTVSKVSPGGGSGDALTSAITKSDGGGAGVLALVLGLLLSLVSLTMAMAQVERGANRVYGLDTDRPSREKYVHAAKLAAALAPVLGLGFLLLIAGGAFVDAATGTYHWSGAGRTLVEVLRWPLGIALLVVGITVLFERAPRRNQPSLSWLALGAATAISLTVVVTGALAAYLHLSSSFSQTYGPLAGIIALLIWSQLSAGALFLGIAVCAELEALRAGQGS